MNAFRRFFFVAGALAAMAGVPISNAGAHPLLKAHAGSGTLVAKAHYHTWDNDDGYRYHRGYYNHRRYYGENVVDAPYAHVETGRRVIVDAPYAHVYSGPRGRHIVAPFVDLWVPY